MPSLKRCKSYLCGTAPVQNARLEDPARTAGSYAARVGSRGPAMKWPGRATSGGITFRLFHVRQAPNPDEALGLTHPATGDRQIAPAAHGECLVRFRLGKMASTSDRSIYLTVSPPRGPSAPWDRVRR